MDEERSFSVIVTGGASGIGAATARRIVAAGGHVAILDLNLDAAEALAAELGPRAVASRGDVLDEAAFEAAHQSVASRLAPINRLVNCAGIAPPAPIEDWPVERDLTPIINATPMGRLLRPQELAEVIYFLLSPAARGVTGATVPCDGGVLAGCGWFPFGGLPQ